MDRQNVAQVINNPVIFKNLSSDPLISSLAAVLGCCEEQTAYSKICALAGVLYESGDNLTEAVFSWLLSDENCLIKTFAKGETPPDGQLQWARHELDALAQAASVTPEMLGEMFAISQALPFWKAENRNFSDDYFAAAKNAPQNGYGVFAESKVFTVSETGELLPVKNPDKQRLSQLYGYEIQRRQVVDNTRALLMGLPAANVFLYGDAGTGKSSTVKAVANEFAHRGLRLIQVEKSCLRFIPALLDKLADNPLSFIIFIDDLSFQSEDKDFTALKTILEGSVAAKATNTVVYATGNRRHLIRESMDARRGDEVHLNDTLEETASLSARFGMTVSFTRPDKDEFAELILSLARQYGVTLPKSQLLSGGEAFALRCGGRSPRAAKQYIEYKKSVGAAEI